LIAWLRALLGPTFGAAPHSIGHLPDVSSLTRSSRALPANQITALPPVPEFQQVISFRFTLSLLGHLPNPNSKPEWF
jgi:hypothetical protein